MLDVWTTVAAERGALADDLADLTAGQWATPSWCAGWSVHDVLAHLCAGADTGRAGFVAGWAAAGFDLDRYAARQVRRYRRDVPADTLATFRRLQFRSSAPPGPRIALLGEVVVHGQDIRRPLGLEHRPPASALRRLLDHQVATDAVLGSRRRVADLGLRASDDDWAHGSGPVVEGPLVDLLLAVAGRAAACSRLAGDGVTTLRLRCPA